MPTPVHLQDDQHERFWKSIVLTVGVSALFLALILRLVYLQVIQAQTSIRLSAENSMQLSVLKAPRGRIFDRNGRFLARNRPSYAICVLPYKLKNRRDVTARLCRIMDSDGEAVFDSVELVRQISRAFSRRFDPTPILEDASMEMVSIVEEHSRELPGIVVSTESRREYPLGTTTFHVLGYMGEIPEEQFDSMKAFGYMYGDLLGKAAIEKQYETPLRGKNGREYIEVNAYGKRMGAIADMPRVAPVPGDDAYLTIDADLQRVADSAFADTLRGAVVAIDPRNGEVLVMFSSPAVDPNIFSLAPARRNKFWAAAATDPNLPLNNRATMGTYTPGSTFKLVSATAGLEAGGFTATTHMPRPCFGSYRIGSRVAKCWLYPRGHGRLGLVDAVKQSCNVFFYQVGLALGDEKILRYAEKLGLGSATGVDLPQEKDGWLSGEKEYNKRFASRGWKWTAGLVLDLAIGQSEVVTPMQLATMVASLGNASVRYRPHILSELRSREGIVTRQIMPMVAERLDLEPRTIETIHTAMRNVIEPGGTGGRAAVPGVPVGGKTGSAENPQGDLTHAVFVACAPVDSPVIAISVVVENAGHGGSVAAPIAGAVLRYYFANKEEGRSIVAALQQKALDQKASRTRKAAAP